MLSAFLFDESLIDSYKLDLGVDPVRGNYRCSNR